MVIITPFSPFKTFQSLKKISKFIHTNILPGATVEVGLLCCACVHSNPEEAAIHLIKPILIGITTSLREMPATAFGGGSSGASSSTKVCFIPNSYNVLFIA